MTYPVVVVALVVLILSAMLLFIVPQFKSIYAQLGGTLPMPTRILLVVSQAMQKYWYYRASSACWWLASPSGGTRRPTRARASVDRIKLKIPVFGSLFHKTAIWPGSRARAAMLLKSGVPILQALDIVTRDGEQLGDLRGRQDVQASVREGESICQAARQARGVPADGGADAGGR